MQIKETGFDGLLIITPKVFQDQRGYFMESYNHNLWHKILKTKFVQDNESMSDKGVLRGLHFQHPPFSQDKLVRVINGSILDVVVDLRKKSNTYGKHFKIVLSGNNKKQLFIPKGFAHGFLSLENKSILSYKCSEYYHSESDASLLWNDKTLNINWQIKNPIISEKDNAGEEFADFKTPF